MRLLILAASVSMFAACGQPPATNAPVAPAADLASPAPAPAAPSAAIDGWEIDMTAYGKIGSPVPGFAAKLADGKDITAESLRGRWTILGVWPEGAAPAEEANFASALNSAVDQDPDLDLLIIHRSAPTAAELWPWPLIIDDGRIAASINAPSVPAYLLVGPDLTIEGYRGALTTTPDDGIKSVIRGVAEVRKQVAAPQ